MLSKGLLSLVDRALSAIGAEQDDHPLDLPPAAEMDHVSDVAAVRGAAGGLVGGMDAEPSDQIGRVGYRRAVRQMDMIGHAFPGFCDPVEAGFSGKALESGQRPSSTARKPQHPDWLDVGESGMERAMTDPAPPPPTRAGGVLLAAGILGGVVIGSALGQASIGFLVGLGVGMLAVVGVWYGDRRRRR